MAQSQAVQRAPKENGHGATGTTLINPTDWMVGWKPLFWGCSIIMAANVFLWVWNYNYMFTAGLNSASAESLVRAVRPEITTWAPCAASAFAPARPMPEPRIGLSRIAFAR